MSNILLDYNFAKINILIIGDIMLDRYYYGSVSRISPEAPVPVINVKSEVYTMGGAGNVANNIRGLTSNCSIIGIAKEDEAGKLLQQMFNNIDIKTHFIDADMPTISKLRVIGGKQQIARLDFEDIKPLNEKLTNQVKSIYENQLKEHDVVIISDYGKGLVTKSEVHSNKIINMLPDKIMPQSLDRDKVNYSAMIDEKLKGIDPAYTEICNTLTANWVSLPATAFNANKTFSSMSDQVVKQKYLTFSIDSERFVNIPWWKKLFEKGEYLVKHDAAFGTVNLIKQYQGNFSRFPLYADGNAANSLEMTELFDLKYILNDFGWIADNSTSSSEIISIKAPLKLTGLVKNEEHVKQWGKDILTIINTLTATPIPLEWSLFVPDEIKQIEMAKNSGINTALPLFRYVEFSSDNNTKNYKKFYTASDKESKFVIAKDNAIAGNFSFNFYAHSDNSTAEGSVKVNGKWSILKLYLDKNTVKESDTIYYVPIYVQDERGLVYIYYLGVEFNKPMPDRQRWPNKYNWPNFS